MADTRGRPGSKAWIRAWFSEYIREGKRIRLRTGWGRFSGHEDVRECTPWRFAQNELGKINIYGFIITPVLGKWYNSTIATPVTDDEYEAFINSLNYYKNGGLTMYGGPGLDPALLYGGFRGVGRQKPYQYHCPTGIYIAETFGKPATFQHMTGPDAGKVWIGDHQLKDYDWVKHD